MALAPEQAGIGIRRHFTTDGVHPYDELDVGAARRPHHQLPRRLGRLRAARRRVPHLLVAERHQHRRPEVLPRHPRHRRSGSRRCARSSTGWPTRSPSGASRAATSSTSTRPTPTTPSSSTSSSPRRRPSTRRCGSTSACPACPSRARPASSSPSTTRWTRSSTGTSRRARSSRAAPGSGINLSKHPLLGRAAQGRRHRLGPGQLHARRRRLRRHHQVRRQDPPRRQDGHPQRRPPRRRGVHLGQGPRGEEDPGPRGGRLRHEPRRQGHGVGPVPERQQLRPGHRRVHAGRGRRRRLAPAGRHRRRDRAARSRRATSCARSPRPPGSAPTRACSSTPRSTTGTPPPTPGGSTARTRAASTCTSTTRPATWPASTC